MMETLLVDPSVRVRLIAAGSILGCDPEDTRARAVVTAILADASPRVRNSALALVESLGGKGGTITGGVGARGRQGDLEVKAPLNRLVDRQPSRSETVIA